MMPDTVEFAFGDVVFHLTDPDEKGVICQITFFPGGHFFNVQWGPSRSSNHYAFELTREKVFSNQ